MEERLYFKTLKKIIESGTINHDDQILVVCGGGLDFKILRHYNFSNVTISNLDDRMGENEYHPYNWSYQNVENITYETDSFDWVIVHAGLHHCYSPHRGFIEMIRVAKIGVMVFEARNSFLMKTGLQLNLVAKYELEAVLGNNMLYGGVENSSIPNFVYRWTEEEVVNIVNSYYPQYSDNSVTFYYGLRYPLKRLKKSSNKLKVLLAYSLRIPVMVFSRLFPKQGNEFVFIVKKGLTLQSWLTKDDLSGDISPNKSYFDLRFNQLKKS